MDAAAWDRVSRRIASRADEVFRLQQELTRIPALAPENGGEGEFQKAERLKRLLDEIGFDAVEEIPAPDRRVPSGIRPNLIALVNGKSDKKTVWILSHLDVVPPGDRSQWKHDPFDAVREDGTIIGRGTEDNHQGIVSSLVAVEALRAEGLAPEYTVGLVFVSDEETGSAYGLGHVLKQRPERFRPLDWILVPDAGDPEGTTIETAEKSILWIRAEIQGRQTHGSTPEKGANAHKAGARLIVRMDDLYRLHGQCDPLFDPPGSTFEPTKKEANVPNINTIPGEDVFCFDCRVLPGVPLAGVQHQIRLWADETERLFCVRIRIDYPQAVQAPPPTPPDAPVVLGLQRAVRDVLGRSAVPRGIGGGTVAAHFREKGFHAVCWTCLDDTCHAANEYSKIENTLNDARVFAHLFLQR